MQTDVWVGGDVEAVAFGNINRTHMVGEAPNATVRRPRRGSARLTRTRPTCSARCRSVRGTESPGYL